MSVCTVNRILCLHVIIHISVFNEEFQNIKGKKKSLICFRPTWLLRKQATFKEATRGSMALSPLRGTRQ